MENKQLTLGSLFDGSGGFPLGGLLTGQITPLWSSEVEPFAIRVTTRRLPWVKHYGDVSAISGADLPPVDIITFGSPCQDIGTIYTNELASHCVKRGLAASIGRTEAVRYLKKRQMM